MLEIKIDGVYAQAKGDGTPDEIITDAVLAVLSATRVLSDELHIHYELTFAKLYVAAAAALSEYRIEKVKDESVSMPDLSRFFSEEGKG